MKLTLFTLLMLVFQIVGLCQTVPQSTSYQAVARDSEGFELSNANLNVRISILSPIIDGDVQWQETHELLTNNFGLFMLNIGEGTSTGSGLMPSYLDVDWANGDHFLKVEIDPGDGIYELMGTSQLLAVPYAYHARTVEIDNFEDADADPGNELINDVSLNDAVLTIEEGGQTFDVDLENLTGDDDWTIEDDVIYNNSNSVGINTSNPTSAFEIDGSFARSVNYISISDDTNISLDENDHTLIIELNSAQMEVTLPLASSCPGREYIIKAISGMATDNVVISGDSIDGNAELIINGVLKESAHLISAGSEGWFIID